MRSLKVFRVQPHAYEAFQKMAKDAENKSEVLRTIVQKSCTEKPPTEFPARKIKTDLVAFSLFMSEVEHSYLVKASAAAGVSRNVFMEAILTKLDEKA